MTIKPEAKVRFRSDRSRVGWVIEVTGDNARLFIDGSTKLVPISQLEPVRELTELDADRLRNLLTFRRLEHPVTDQLFSFKASRTVLYYHQFIPVKKMLESPDQRLLIADEVGTGKTIEAGLIWAELESRSAQGLENVWIVCPKSLVGKWQDEMLRRFDFRLEPLSPEGLRHAMASLERDGVLSPRFAKSIVNLELLRTRTVLERLIESPISWDLVIFDEAHHLRNPSTNSHLLASLMCGHSKAALFLTATPLQTSLADIVHLMEVLGVDVATDDELLGEQLAWDMGMNDWILMVRRQPPGWRREAARRLQRLAVEGGNGRPGWERFRRLVEEADLEDRRQRALVVDAARDVLVLSPYMTRTLRSDVDENRPIREAITARTELSPEHHELYRTMYEVCVERARRDRLPPGFITQMPERRTSSCAPAVAAEILRYTTEDESDPNQTRFSAAELTRLEPLARAALGAEDRKLRALHQILDQVFGELGADRVMIFSTFRGTLRYLAEELGNSGYSLELMYGPTPVRQEDCRKGEKSRERIADEFRQGRFQILLASEVAGEGLDFEHCHVVINYDLPWNPMRVEQRIGRCDRIGQRSDKVYIGNLVCAETIEGRILERLYTRLHVFERALGHMELVLGEISSLRTDLFSRGLTPDQQEARLERILEAAERRDLDRETISRSGVISDQGRRLLESEHQEIMDAEACFLSPQDVSEFVSTIINRKYPRSIRRRATGGVHTVRSNEGLQNALKELLTSYPSTHYARPEILRFRKRLRKSGKLRISFADEADGVEFVHIRHPLLLLARRLGEEYRVDSPWCFGVVPPDMLERPTMVVWAIGSLDGYTHRAELICAAADWATGEVELIPIDRAQQLIRAMSTPTRGERVTGVDMGDPRARAEEVLMSGFKEAEAVFATRDDLLTGKAKQAVRSLARRQIDRNDRQLADPDLDPKMRRLYTGWNRNIKEGTRARLDEIDRKGQIRSSLEIIGMAVLHPQDPPEGSTRDGVPS